MPKKIPESEQNADPVRSRMAALASQAAAAPSAAKPAPAVPPPPVAQPSGAPSPRKRPRSDGGGEAPPQRRVVSRQAPPVRRLGGSDLTEERKARFTKDEAEANDDIVALITRLTGSKPSQACIARVLWYLLRMSEDSLRSRSARAPQLKRPPNGFGIETAEYEQQLARYLLTGIKDVQL